MCGFIGYVSHDLPYVIVTSVTKVLAILKMCNNTTFCKMPQQFGTAKHTDKQLLFHVQN